MRLPRKVTDGPRSADSRTHVVHPAAGQLRHAEWITLHDNPNIRGFVDFLSAELDRVGPAHADLCRDFFRSRCRTQPAIGKIVRSASCAMSRSPNPAAGACPAPADRR